MTQDFSYISKVKDMTANDFYKEYNKVREYPNAPIPYDQYEHKITHEKVNVARKVAKTTTR
jgi:hypothetical protein